MGPFDVKASKVYSTRHRLTTSHTAQSTMASWIQAASAVNRKYLQPFYIKIRDYITDLWQDSWDYSDTGDF